MRLAQAKLTKTASQAANLSAASSSAQPIHVDLASVEAERASVVALLLALKHQIKEDRAMANARYEENKASQTVLLSEVQQLRN